MKFKSLSTVKYLLLLSLGIASTSGYWGHRMMDDNANLSQAMTSLEVTRDKSQTALDFVTSEFEPDGVKVVLDMALSKAMLDVYNLRVEHQVGITQVRVANATGGALAADIAQFAETVPNTDLRSVKVTINGDYADYAGFLSYIETLRTSHPVSVVFLKVEEKTFELSVRVYGV